MASSPASRGQGIVARKPLNATSLQAANARLRDGPQSPVRVDLGGDENWPRPSTAHVQNSQAEKAYGAVTPHNDGQHEANARQAHAESPVARHRPSNTELDSILAKFDRASLERELPPLPLAAHGKVRDRLLERDSRQSDETTSSSQNQASANSSATTSASSVSGINDVAEDLPSSDSPESSILDGNLLKNLPVPQFQYHHQQPHESPARASTGGPGQFTRSPSSDLLEHGMNIRRHLTPTSAYMQRTSLTRPQSSYSTLSDFSPRARSPNPHFRAPSAQSRHSPDVRLSTYAELLNVPYPQQAPAPLSLDNSNLRTVVGNNASLLSTQKTLEMYRQNVKKTNDFSIQYSFAVFLISTAQEQGLNVSDPKASKKQASQGLRDLDSPVVESSVTSPYELVREARQILQRLANGGYPFAQYYLADGYSSGLFSKGREDYNTAFPLFVLAAKHGHAESAYRTALCYEFGWGCRKDPAKAVQFLRTAAAKRHPGAMTRLGKACLSGDLGEKRYREGLKWLKLATEAADVQYNAAPYQLGCLYETGYGDDVFTDASYAAELFTQAADLGHPEANYRMGDAYEHGKLNCPRDPALSVHFYTGAAERGHAGAMMGLCAWYMVGAPPILDKDEEEAYEWACRSANLGKATLVMHYQGSSRTKLLTNELSLGFVKAQYAVGYFTEMGIGCRRDILEANVWYVKAADAGDERAKQRIAVIQAAVSGEGTPMDVAPPRAGKKGAKDDKDCVVM
ncbi:protoplast regeneration and killer toxin resistance protein [Moelleriella libera RCEF 2490]|uniref:Protoplast regeneration and killer toxin resistance protein n=1 Tax=Moelleriella libera RCEF 2490 TaxID=1081109 RepID=A0A168B427_9HYPO|nr:protoplast regeneration and killer toxin resistance protein [Moelleriella libera RCEF 2490]